MIRLASTGMLAAVSFLALAVVSRSASAQGADARDTGAAVWRLACASCHGEGSFNGQTLRTIRTLGEPRIRHTLIDPEESVHSGIQKLSEARMALLLDYLKPDADVARHCNPTSPDPAAAPDCADDPPPANAPAP